MAATPTPPRASRSRPAAGVDRPDTNRTLSAMEPTALTIVSQLIVDAQTRHGAANVSRIDVEDDVLDSAMDQVLALGGEVGLDWCRVDGVEVRALPDGTQVARAWLRGEDEPRPLTPIRTDAADPDGAAADAADGVADATPQADDDAIEADPDGAAADPADAEGNSRAEDT